MKKVFFLFLLVASPLIIAKDVLDEDDKIYFNDIKSFLLENRSNPMIKDVLFENKISPPYEDTQKFNKLAEKCYGYFDSNKKKTEFLKTSVMDEVLGTSANQGSLLTSFIKNSRGWISIHDYVSADFKYIAKSAIQKRKNHITEDLYSEFVESPRYQKLSEYSDYLTGEGRNEYASKLFSTCLRVEIFYSILGGREYSKTLEVIKGVRNIIHTKATSDLKKSVEGTG